MQIVLVFAGLSLVHISLHSDAFVLRVRIFSRSFSHLLYDQKVQPLSQALKRM